MNTEPPSIAEPVSSGLTHSPSIAAIGAALAAAQGEMSGAAKDSSNPFFKSRYADLASIIVAIRGPLTRHKIAHIQNPGIDSDGPFVDTMLVHESGEWFRGRIRMAPVKNDPQGIGSVITYQRRYALQAIVGLEADDDDGNRATHGHEQPAKSLPRTQPLRPGSFETVKTAVEAPSATPSVAPEPASVPNSVPPIITNWRDVLYVSKGKSKRLGDLSETFRDDLVNFFSSREPKTKAEGILKAALALYVVEKSGSTSFIDALAAKAKVEKVDIALLLKVAQKNLGSTAQNFFDTAETDAQQLLENWESTLEYVKFELDNLP